MPTRADPPGMRSFEERLAFEKEKLSPVVVYATLVLIGLFLLGFLFRLVGLLL